MQRQCQTCPNLLPEDCGRNKRFCSDCKTKRQREYFKTYFTRQQEVPDSPYLSHRDRQLLLLAKKYRRVLNKLAKEEKKEEIKKQDNKSYITERMGDILEHRVAGDMTLEELGAKWKISKERIRQLEKIARKLTGNEIRRDKECKYCLRTFIPQTPIQRYCNPVCSKLWHKEHPQIISPEQRAEFAKRYKLKHASEHFRWRVETVCANPGCGKVFTPNMKNQKFCGSYVKKTGCSYWTQKHFTSPDSKKSSRLHTYCQVCDVELEWRRSGTRFLRNHKYCDTHKEVIRRVSTKIGWHIYPRAEIAEVLRELIKPYDTQQTNPSGEERFSAERQSAV